jgi:8-oxo-dGTP pyrophosphatase MutT (NUDIX family)
MPAERVSRVVSVAVVHRHRILVVERSPNDSFPGSWELPGGAVEGHETFERAAHRELEEETGISDHDLEEISHTVRPPVLPGSVRYALFDERAFRVRVEVRPRVRLNPGEHSRHRWVTKEELEALPMLEPKRAIAVLALDGADGARAERGSSKP